MSTSNLQPDIEKSSAAVFITRPEEGTTVVASLLFKGGGDPGATVELFLKNQSLGTTKVDPFYNWEFPVGPLANGSYTIKAQQRSTHGMITSATVSFSCLAERPVSITWPLEGGDYLGGAHFQIEGTAHATIVATEDGEVIDEGTCDQYGQRTFDYESAVLGKKTVLVTQTSQNSIVTTANVSFFIISGATEVHFLWPENDSSVSPTLRFHGYGDLGAQVVLTDGETVIGQGTVDHGDAHLYYWEIPFDAGFDEGSKTIVATQTTVSEEVSTDSVTFNVINKLPVLISFPEDDSTVSSAFAVQGRGTVGATVRLTEGMIELGNADVDGFNQWRIPVENASDGEKEYVATQNYMDGQSTSDSVKFRVLAQRAVTIDYPEQDSTIPDLYPEFRGEGEPEAEVLLLVDGDIAIGDGTVNAEGHWFIPIKGPGLVQGINFVTARQITQWGDFTEATVTFFID